MATDMADQGHDMHAHFSPPPPGLSSTHPGTHPDVHPVPASSSHSDQDVLFDLILQRVPPPKQEMLSTSWSRDYLNRLTSLPARALQSEPEKLREEHQKVERDMSELAFRDYKAFILVKDCKQEVQTTFESLGQHLDRFQDSIPEFVETLSGCSARVAPLLEQQHVYGTILASHSQLLEVLEIPLLMETCVRNGYYSEALELAAHVQRLAYRYPGIGVIEDIETKVGQGKEMMLVQLLAQLREPIKLPVALRVVGFLRRIGSFKGQVKSFDDDDADDADDDEDEERGKNGNHRDKAGNSISSKGTGLERTRNSHSSSSSSGPRGSPHETGLEDETPLRMLFLKSRGQYMNQQLAKIVFHKGDSFGYIDVTRECLFDIMTYYKSIFSSLDQFMTGSSSS
ncbi:conserved oligomeric Golgi complex component, partial [Lunasporangiospora selenospora]